MVGEHMHCLKSLVYACFAELSAEAVYSVSSPEKFVKLAVFEEQEEFFEV